MRYSCPNTPHQNREALTRAIAPEPINYGAAAEKLVHTEPQGDEAHPRTLRLFSVPPAELEFTSFDPSATKANGFDPNNLALCG
jgi:hypothetical protein